MIRIKAKAQNGIPKEKRQPSGHNQANYSIYYFGLNLKKIIRNFCTNFPQSRFDGDISIKNIAKKFKMEHQLLTINAIKIKSNSGFEIEIVIMIVDDRMTDEIGS